MKSLAFLCIFSFLSSLSFASEKNERLELKKPHKTFSNDILNHLTRRQVEGTFHVNQQVILWNYLLRDISEILGKDLSIEEKIQKLNQLHAQHLRFNAHLISAPMKQSNLSRLASIILNNQISKDVLDQVLHQFENQVSLDKKFIIEKQIRINFVLCKALSPIWNLRGKVGESIRAYINDSFDLDIRDIVESPSSNQFWERVRLQVGEQVWTQIWGLERRVRGGSAFIRFNRERLVTSRLAGNNTQEINYGFEDLREAFPLHREAFPLHREAFPLHREAFPLHRELPAPQIIEEPNDGENLKLKTHYTFLIYQIASLSTANSPALDPIRTKLEAFLSKTLTEEEILGILKAFEFPTHENSIIDTQLELHRIHLLPKLPPPSEMGYGGESSLVRERIVDDESEIKILPTQIYVHCYVLALLIQEYFVFKKPSA